MQKPQIHSAEVHQVYERILAGASARRRFVEVVGRRVHVLEQGTGPAMVLLHGTGNGAGFMLPLLNELREVSAIAPDLPGVGLSDPVDTGPEGYRDDAVSWLESFLDTLALDTITLLGHSGGAVRALWFALAHPDRVEQLVLIDPPALPGTRCPLPIRLVATPGLGALLPRLAPPSPKTTLQLAGFMGEKDTLPRYPELIELMVALGRDPVTDRSSRAEFRALASPFGLLSPSGFRRRERVRPDELRRLAAPTLLVWGERDPLGDASVARAAVDLMPRGRLAVLPTGHAPWLGLPGQTAATVMDFLEHSRQS
jgi:2-hydroxy-6-oxonona-2,4-dienedioate hydrolase